MPFAQLRFSRSTRRVFSLVALAATLVTGSGCKQEQSAPLPEKPLVLDPVPIPADLIADVYMPNPDTAWGKARLAIGGPAMFLPASTGSLAATLFGLPITVGTEIDGNVPIVGAILEGKDGGRARVAMALHLRAADKFIHLLVQGENARHTKRVDEKTQITLLELQNGALGSAAIGVLGNYLVAAPTKEELLEVAPYVVRNLTTAKAPTNDITIDMPRAALEGPVAKTLRSKWDGIKPKPRADSTVTTLPSPLQTLVDGVLGVLGELDRGKAMIDFDQQATHVRFSGTPKAPLAPGSRIASMTVGDPKKLLGLPGSTDVAVFVHDAADGRMNDAKGYAKALSEAIGKDVTDEDKAAIEKALSSLAKSRGDTFAAGLSLLPSGPGVFVRSSMSDRDALAKSIDDLVGLSERKSVARWLGDLGLTIKGGTTVIEGLPGDLRRIHLERVEPKVPNDKPGVKPGSKAQETTKKEEKKDDKKPDQSKVQAGVPSAIDILYVFGTENVVLGAGYEAQDALKLGLEATEKDNLGTRTDVATALASLGDKATFVAVADLLRLFARQSGGATPAAGAPLVFGLGKGGTGFGAEDPWMRLDVPNVVLQEIVKRRGAF